MPDKLAIITGYFPGEGYGLLGPQTAATVIRDHTHYDCIVVGVTRQDDKALLKHALADYFGRARPVIGFSYLGGREDLFSLARELKEDGAVTILAGPQAEADFAGEAGHPDHPHRFEGVADSFDFALQGPAEQAVTLLENLSGTGWKRTAGLVYRDKGGTIVRNPNAPWDTRFLRTVDWGTLYRLNRSGLVPHRVDSVQVLQQIGCPHASHRRQVEIGYPAELDPSGAKRIRLPVRGCTFCDVAVDKGFFGTLDSETVLAQIRGVPSSPDGRKCPFELINENALFGLPDLLADTAEQGIRLSQINLTLRADWFLLAERHLTEALARAASMGVRVLLASVGFESFDDTILGNLNKGLSVETNLRAIRLMRRLKEEFPGTWGYSRSDGAVHGFIHPTPWDTAETEAADRRRIGSHGLLRDIIPDHSTPLIIHHASPLGDWIREIEDREAIRYRRYGTIVGWWQRWEPP